MQIFCSYFGSFFCARRSYWKYYLFYIWLSIYLSIYLCTYTYTHTHTHTHTHIYIYVCIYIERERGEREDNMLRDWRFFSEIQPLKKLQYNGRPKKTQRYNTVIWLTMQLTCLRKKIYSLKNWLTDWNPSTQKPQNFVFRKRYIKKTTQEDQW